MIALYLFLFLVFVIDTDENKTKSVQEATKAYSVIEEVEDVNEQIEEVYITTNQR
jgi:hypothetical protein